MSDLFDDRNISPMLLYETQAFDDEDYIYELKLDGIRCIAYLGDGKVVLQNKRYKDVTALYPELHEMHCCVRRRTVLDGELVVLRDGKPDFYALQKRSLMGNAFKISLAAKSNPVQFVAYDILYNNGKDLTDLPLMERKKYLSEKVAEGYNLSVSDISKGRGRRSLNSPSARGWRGSSLSAKTGNIISASGRAIG